MSHVEERLASAEVSKVLTKILRRYDSVSIDCDKNSVVVTVWDDLKHKTSRTEVIQIEKKDIFVALKNALNEIDANKKNLYQLRKKARLSAISSDVFVSKREVALRYGISENTVGRMIDDGRFPQPIKIGGTILRWNIEDLIKWEKSLAS